MAAAYQLHLHGLLRPPPARPLRPISAPQPPYRARPALASLRIPPPPPPPPLKKPVSRATEANREAAAAAVVEEEENEAVAAYEEGYVSNVGSGDPSAPPAYHPAARAGLRDPVFFLLTFVAVTTSVAFTSMVTVAIPTMLAMRRAADSFTMLADVALEELPSTMAAVRLSGMEISDLTLELSDLSRRTDVPVGTYAVQTEHELTSTKSQDIAGGVTKSAKIVQAVEDGIGQMRNIARQQTTSMIEERANLRTIPTAAPAKKSNESSRRQRDERKDQSSDRAS